MPFEASPLEIFSAEQNLFLLRKKTYFRSARTRLELFFFIGTCRTRKILLWRHLLGSSFGHVFVSSSFELDLISPLFESCRPGFAFVCGVV